MFLVRYVTARDITAKLLEVKYKGKNIHDVLNMTAEEALEFFENVPSLKKRIETINDVGLGYIKTWPVIYRAFRW